MKRDGHAIGIPFITGKATIFVRRTSDAGLIRDTFRQGNRLGVYDPTRRLGIAVFRVPV
jgi:hypothetical protein